MSNGQRFGLIAVALVIAVGAFFLLRSPGDEAQQAAAPAPAPAEDASAPAAEEDGSTPTAEPQKPPEPPATEIEVEGGAPVGGVAEVKAKKGDEIRFEVTADAPAEVHVHGYELTEQVDAGRAAKFSFPAELEGVYEVELEETATPIAELRVSP